MMTVTTTTIPTPATAATTTIHQDIKWWAYFAMLRARRPHAQVTHVFIPCHVHEDGALSCQQRPELGLFQYLSPWGVAQLILSLGVTEIHIQPLRHKAHEAASVLVEPAGASRALWPKLERQRGGVVQPSTAVSEAAAMLEAAEPTRPRMHGRRGPSSAGRCLDGSGDAQPSDAESEGRGQLSEGLSGESSCGDEDEGLVDVFAQSADGAGEPAGGAGQLAQGPAHSAVPAARGSGDAQVSDNACPAAPSGGAAQPASDNRQQGRRCKEGYQTFEVEGVGRFVFDIAASSLAAHCRGHGHGPCRINKVLRKAPIGGFVAWLRDGGHHETQISHMQAWRNRSAEDGPLTYERRRLARQSLPDTPSMHEVLALERGFCSDAGSADFVVDEPVVLE